MTWASHHREAEKHAAAAELRLMAGDRLGARRLYRRAATAEEKALESLDPMKVRTLGITVVSATALWYKAAQYQRAEAIGTRWLAHESLPDFAKDQVRDILQRTWIDMAQNKSEVNFIETDLLFRVKGERIVHGGAPLELILDKVGDVRSMVYRAAEYTRRLPLRKHGQPDLETQQFCEPWLFQAPAGSYQFALRIKEPEQTVLFPEQRPEATAVVKIFLGILRAVASGEPQSELPAIVDDPSYRDAFLRLSRNLTPTKTSSYGSLEIRSASQPSGESIVLLPAHRDIINATIRSSRPKGEVKKTGDEVATLHGTLRRLDLDNDWLVVLIDGKPVKVTKAGDALEDVIGPMVNRPVTVEAIRRKDGEYEYIDIELAE